MALVAWQVVGWRRLRQVPQVASLRQNISSRERFDQILVLIVDMMVGIIPLLGFLWLLGTWVFLRLKISAFFIINPLASDNKHCTLSVRHLCPRCRGPLKLPQHTVPPNPPRLAYAHRSGCRFGKISRSSSRVRFQGKVETQELDGELSTVSRYAGKPWFSSLRVGLRIPAFMLLAFLFLNRIINDSDISFDETFALNVTLVFLFSWFLYSVVKSFWYDSDERKISVKHARLLEHALATAFLMIVSLILFQVVVQYLVDRLMVIVVFIFLLVLLFHRERS